MGNIETLYELRGITDYVVASPTEIPSDGMPYNLNVGCFFELVPDLKGAARNTFDYYDVQSGKYRSCTISVYDMSKIDRVAKATRNIMLENLIIPRRATVWAINSVTNTTTWVITRFHSPIMHRFKANFSRPWMIL